MFPAPPQLGQFDIEDKFFTFRHVTLQSDRYLAVREEGKKSLALIDTGRKAAFRLPIEVRCGLLLVGFELCCATDLACVLRRSTVPS